MSEDLPSKVLMRAAGLLDRKWGWARLPIRLSIVTLIGLRETLRRENLFDPAGVTVGWGPERPAPLRSLARTLDGAGTDPRHRAMGSAGSNLRVGRPARRNRSP